MGVAIFIICLIIFFIGLFIKNEMLPIDYTPTSYESEMIEYFKEVALKSEFDENIGRIIKWKKPMILFVSKDDEYKKQTEAIKKSINKINELVTDGFKIELTEDVSNSNAILFLCEKRKVEKLAPDFYKSFTDDIDIDISGFAYIEFNWSNYNIRKAFIYVDPKEPIDVQESTVLEEITQSIGLPNDPESHTNSIFYEHKSEENINIKEYSKMDSDIIRLLYHPKMKPGLNSRQCEKVIKKILQKEAKK
ncbi:DUF2927 domain-containing protein [Muricauda sp. SCSIO 64092]|uniref:DUF2927 domain-containing protein n=1 Tax=Allomuricauda sp. SCSIO 64092 TaxID=2908842 RepID=UPI001FF2CE9A|nr:DUF2927 domain-containing protein [Muricauda sp. SCSIO 64092]UOY08889.1 DUF2927 domain-containing protein [Muricauda sp. SCSIO 64092]